MLSYCHRYHAGNFADIHKHMALITILSHFHKKTTPFAVLDAYAGEGWYDLSSVEIQKNKEYLQGYEKYKQNLVEINNLVEIANFYQTQQKRAFIYPGSPAIIAKYLRAQDRAIFTELHPNAYRLLEKNLKIMAQSRAIYISNRDGLEAIKALLPFKEGRGLVFVDPSYEIKAEYQTVADTIRVSYPKFSQGIYVIWYPILEMGYHHVLVNALLDLVNHSKIKPEFYQSEWIPDPSIKHGLIGSGLFVINPPWQFEEKMQLLTTV